MILNSLTTPSPPAHKKESPEADTSQVKHPLENPPILTIGSSSLLKTLHSFVTPPPAMMYSLPVSMCFKNLDQKTRQDSLPLNTPFPFQSMFLISLVVSKSHSCNCLSMRLLPLRIFFPLKSKESPQM